MHSTQRISHELKLAETKSAGGGLSSPIIFSKLPEQYKISDIFITEKGRFITRFNKDDNHWIHYKCWDLSQREEGVWYFPRTEDSFLDMLKNIAKCEVMLANDEDQIAWQQTGFDTAKKKFFFDAFKNKTFFFHPKCSILTADAIKEFFIYDHLSALLDNDRCLFIDNETSSVKLFSASESKVVNDGEKCSDSPRNRALITLNNTLFLVKEHDRKIDILEWNPEALEFKLQHSFSLHARRLRFVFPISNHELIFICNDHFDGRLIKYDSKAEAIVDELHVPLVPEWLDYQVLSRQDHCYLLTIASYRTSRFTGYEGEKNFYLLDAKNRVIHKVELEVGFVPIGFIPDRGFVIASADQVKVIPNPKFVETYKATAEKFRNELIASVPDLSIFAEVIQGYVGGFSVADEHPHFKFRKFYPEQERLSPGDEKAGNYIFK